MYSYREFILEQKSNQFIRLRPPKADFGGWPSVNFPDQAGRDENNVGQQIDISQKSFFDFYLFTAQAAKESAEQATLKAAPLNLWSS